MPFIISIICLSILCLGNSTLKITLNEAEAKKAFDYLNLVRQNPSKFSKEIGVDLSTVKSKPKLIWNDTLAKVAQKKAMDMAKRKYFNHVDPDGNGINILIYKAGYQVNPDWIKDKKSNYFESIGAGIGSGEQTIRELIEDKGIPSFSHRKHLLGMEGMREYSFDCGIGIVDSDQSPYNSYCCIIIACKDFKK